MQSKSTMSPAPIRNALAATLILVAAWAPAAMIAAPKAPAAAPQPVEEVTAADTAVPAQQVSDASPPCVRHQVSQQS